VGCVVNDTINLCTLPFNATVSTALVAAGTPAAVIEKSADEPPVGTVTDAGACSSELLLNRAIPTGPDPAG
jgi:hypothetical protein